MADDFTGTKTDKIDKPIAAVVELQSMLRTTQWVAGVLAGTLITIAFTSWRDISGRLNSVEIATAKIAALGEIAGPNPRRFQEFDQRVGELEANLSRLNKQVTVLIDNLPKPPPQ